MMTKLEQAAQALLAHWDTPAWKYLKPTSDLMTDLREALAEQAQQEPVAWCYFCEDALWGFFTNPDECDPDCDNEMPLYAAPVRTKDLTDDEIAKAIAPFQHEFIATGRTTMNFARAVIAADREKNK